MLLRTFEIPCHDNSSIRLVSLRAMLCMPLQTLPYRWALLEDPPLHPAPVASTVRHGAQVPRRKPLRCKRLVLFGSSVWGLGCISWRVEQRGLELQGLRLPLVCFQIHGTTDPKPYTLGPKPSRPSFIALLLLPEIRQKSVKDSGLLGGLGLLNFGPQSRSGMAGIRLWAAIKKGEYIGIP